MAKHLLLKRYRVAWRTFLDGARAEASRRRREELSEEQPAR